VSRIKPDANYHIYLQAMLELAAERDLHVVGTYADIIERVNQHRVQEGYQPISLNAMRTASFRRALHELGGQVLSGRGPVVIGETPCPKTISA
jgi:hypothetical protein